MNCSFRERQAGTYRAVVYLLGMVLSDLPYVLLTFIVFATPQYFMAGFVVEVSGFYIFKNKIVRNEDQLLLWTMNSC